MRTLVVLMLALPLITSDTCLSCHRSPALDTHVSHPSGVAYPRNISLKAEHAPSGFGGTVAEDLLVAGRVECVSCHIEHETETGSDTRDRLRGEVGNVTRLCTGCHLIS